MTITNIQIMEDDDESYPVMAKDVMAAMERNRHGFRFCGVYYSTLRLMLFAGFCLLFAVGCATQTELTALKSQLRISVQRELIAKQDESLTILKSNTNALAAIKSQIDTLKASQSQSEPGNGKECDLESDPPSNAETVVNESHGDSPGSQPVAVSAVELSSPVRQWYLVSETWCVNCPKAKAVFLAKGWPAKNVLTINQCKARFGFMVPYVPYEFGEPLSNTPAGPLLRTVTSSRNDAHFGGSLSHSEMKALHDQLHGGGSWTWPGDLATHLATTHGVSTGGAPLTGAFFPLQGQSGIQSSRPVVRSNSFGSRFVGRSRAAFGKSCPTCPR